MKLALSRKGFDSSAGGCPSPILPDGHLVSDLTRGRVRADASVHLDPDLESSARSRESGWLPAFGREGHAQRHLDRTGVGIDDLFLFFGWFREVEFDRGRYRYREHVPDLHVLFGWLRVGQIMRFGPDPVPAWLQSHPHAVRDGFPLNTVYVAKGVNGAGVFPNFSPRLVLTEAGKPRSVWRLPSDFLPRSRPALTFHESPSRWREEADGCQLRSTGLGEEFVLNLEQYPGVHKWAEEVVSLSS